MAKATVLSNTGKKYSKVLEDLNNHKINIFDVASPKSLVNNKNFFISEVIDFCNNYMSSVVKDILPKALTIYEVPFKIRVQNITVPGYSPSNVPPIGIAIIGFNNYIL
jgi:hypothetical protein